MCWRRASIQDGYCPHAPSDATVQKRFFRDNFVIFRRRSNRIAFFESVHFSMQLFNFRDGHGTTFQHRSGPISAKCLVTDSPDNSKRHRHTDRVSAFHPYHWFGVKLFPLGCAQDSWMVPKTRKNAIFGAGSAHATKFRNFSRYQLSSPPLWQFTAEIVAIRRL